MIKSSTNGKLWQKLVTYQLLIVSKEDTGVERTLGGVFYSYVYFCEYATSCVIFYVSSLHVIHFYHFRRYMTFAFIRSFHYVCPSRGWKVYKISLNIFRCSLLGMGVSQD